MKNVYEKVAGIGLDVHYKFSTVMMRDGQGRVVRRERLEHPDRAALRQELARWPKQIGHVHLKSFWTQDPRGGWDRHKPDFWKTSRFCDLAEGNTGLDVGAILGGLAQAGYRGWIAVEEDHPRRDIAAVARDNREFLRKLGY